MSVNELNGLGGRLLVIFDGRCGFCNGSIRWLLKRDRRDRLRFVASESPKVAGLLARHGFSAIGQRSYLETISPSTILVVRDPDDPGERLFVRSNAALTILAELPQPWRALGVAFGWIPRPLRDLGYRLIARWRYRIWGRLDTCPLPAAGEQARFL